MRQTIEIPPAGTKKKVELTGRSIQVEQMNVYSQASQVPFIDMNPGTKSYPLYPGSRYPNEEGEFDFIYIWGTSESAGDEVFLISTPECLEFEINIQHSSQFSETPGETFTVNATDTAQSLSPLQLADSEGNLPKSVLISARNNPLAWTQISEPDQSDFGNILVHPDVTAGSEREADFLEIDGIEFILEWKFINAINASVSKLIVTPRY